MTLPITITKTEQVELKVPSFWKKNNPNLDATHYIGILNEETAVNLFWLKNYTSVVNGKPNDLMHHIKELSQGEFMEVSEEEFLSYYEDTLAGLSLRPKMVEGFINSLGKIGVIRKEAL